METKRQTLLGTNPDDAGSHASSTVKGIGVFASGAEIFAPGGVVDAEAGLASTGVVIGWPAPITCIGEIVVPDVVDVGGGDIAVDVVVVVNDEFAC
jgi:hypothetical protein